MDSNTILKLIDAGFTAEEIRAMIAAQPVEITPAAPIQEAPDEQPKPEISKAPEAPKTENNISSDISAAISAAIKEALAPVNDMYKNAAKLAGMPSFADIKPLGIEDVVNKFFEE